MQNTFEKSPLMAEIGATYKSLIPVEDRIMLLSSIEVYEYLKSIWDQDSIELVESFYIILLNNAGSVLGWARTAIGSERGVISDPKTIFKLALVHNANKIILAHNHPSGNLTPSYADRSMTEKLDKGAKILDIEILDHLIITNKGYYSLKDNSDF
jgi:DNA repair protein RadC